jgi:hypothetical protein
MDLGAIVLTGFSTVVGVLAGGAITFAVSRRYYRKASEDLRQEAGDLRQETTEIRRRSEELLRYVRLLIDLLEDAGVIAVERDPRTGEPLTVRVLRITHPTATAKGVASHETRVSRAEEQDNR